MSLRVIEDTSSILPWLFSDPGDNDDPGPDLKPPPHGISPDAITILVVDDDLANLALAQALLESEGFQVVVAMDAHGALQILKTVTPALILMDIQLPEVDGWELTRRIKSNPATSGIPVIALTAYGKAGDERKAR